MGHALTDEQFDDIGDIDVLLCPVGGVYTIDPKQAVSVIRSLDPRIVIPMHYKTDAHDSKQFGDMSTVKDFMKEYGAESEPLAKLDIEKGKLPEETELVVLAQI